MHVGEGGQKPIYTSPSEVILLDDAKLDSTNPTPNLHYAVGTGVSNGSMSNGDSRGLPSGKKLDQSSTVARGSKAVVPANNHLPHSRAVLSATINHDEARTTLDSVIGTLTDCQRQIQKALVSPPKEKGSSVNQSRANGYHCWIITVCNVLISIKDNFERNPVEIGHLVKFGPLDPEYQSVVDSITQYEGVAKGTIGLIIWVLTDNPTGDMISPCSRSGVVYEPLGYYHFKRRNGSGTRK